MSCDSLNRVTTIYNLITSIYTVGTFGVQQWLVVVGGVGELKKPLLINSLPPLLSPQLRNSLKKRANTMHACVASKEASVYKRNGAICSELKLMVTFRVWMRGFIHSLHYDTRVLK